MKKERTRATIFFDLPEKVDDEDLAAFIIGALETWGGQRHPEDPLFQSMSIRSVRIGSMLYGNPDPKKFD